MALSIFAKKSYMVSLHATRQIDNLWNWAIFLTGQFSKLDILLNDGKSFKLSNLLNWTIF